MDRRPERASQHNNVSQLRVIDSEVWRNETLADLRAASCAVAASRSVFALVGLINTAMTLSAVKSPISDGFELRG
jgi:hypothetical protein